MEWTRDGDKSKRRYRRREWVHDGWMDGVLLVFFFAGQVWAIATAPPRKVETFRGMYQNERRGYDERVVRESKKN